jgi:hypothetical protein
LDLSARVRHDSLRCQNADEGKKFYSSEPCVRARIIASMKNQSNGERDREKGEKETQKRERKAKKDDGRTKGRNRE